MTTELATTWAGITISALIGITGVIIGIIGLRQSRLSNQLAQMAHQEAQAANKVARESNVISTEANRLAIDANQLSEKSNAIAERATAISIESPDVRWELHWPNPPEILLTNRGDDEARSVKAVIHVDGNEYILRKSAVAPSVPLVLALAHGEGTQMLSEYLKFCSLRKIKPFSSDSVETTAGAVFVSLQVRWESTTGKQFTHSQQPTMFTAGDFDIAEPPTL